MSRTDAALRCAVEMVVAAVVCEQGRRTGDIDDMAGLIEALRQDGEPYPTFAEIGDMVSGVEREEAPGRFVSDCPPHLAARSSALNAWLDQEMGCAE